MKYFFKFTMDVIQICIITCYMSNKNHKYDIGETMEKVSILITAIIIILSSFKK